MADDFVVSHKFKILYTLGIELIKFYRIIPTYLGSMIDIVQYLYGREEYYVKKEYKQSAKI